MRQYADAQEDFPPPLALAPWRVRKAEALPGYRVRVSFNDGTEGVVDLGRQIHAADAGVFASLRDPSLFDQLRVELGVVTWPGDLDLAPDAMHFEILKNGEWTL